MYIWVYSIIIIPVHFLEMIAVAIAPLLILLEIPFIILGAKLMALGDYLIFRGWMLGFVQMIMYGLVAGIVVMVLFVSAQNLVWLTQKQNIANLPVNIKAPPYVKGMPPGKRDTFANRILYGYGAPYSFKDNPIALPFIPCNFPKLQTIFHIKPWMADTLTHTWVDSRKLLKVIMDFVDYL